MLIVHEVALSGTRDAGKQERLEEDGSNWNFRRRTGGREIGTTKSVKTRNVV